MITGKIIQAVDSQDYLTLAIADADLSNLGRPYKIFWQRAKGLYHEQNPRIPLKGTPKLEFIYSQIVLLKKHKFHTSEATVLFHHQVENIEGLKNILY
jgi:hypothetical protein